MVATIETQLELLGRGVVPRVWADMKGPLAEKLKLGRPLRVKCGFDPTAPDLHLGHTVVMNKMRQFQQHGHRVVFLIGDFTAMIGDPTGKSATRPPLSREQVLKNAETYKAQVFKILDPQQTEIRFNSEWLGPMTAEQLVRLAATYTVARLLERNDFKTRYTSGQPISVHEFLYPLVQAYDSVALDADVELGGNDQLFNLMVGREVMREYAKPPQVILTTDLLLGTDGHLEEGALVGEKMSKSLGNYVGVDDPPSGESGMYGKLMSVSDPLMWHYYELLSLVSGEALAAIKAGHPKEAKAKLAFEITERFHGPAAAAKAAEEFERLHPSAGASRGLPEEISSVTIAVEGDTIFLSRVLVEAELAASNSEARRLIAQGGVEVDGVRVNDPGATLARGGKHLLKAGKRRFRHVELG
ncbi:MAG: tyrosine--tRNA ligase [Deltaproteobacteria bacterium]|nr:tyrosine--tRNA ligase [Deltaproteobacteria bacterium]